MGYEPTPGVLTEEDKMRLVLADTGHNVELPENLKNHFDATPKPPESDHEGADEKEATPSLAEPSKADKEAEEARQSTMAHMNQDPEVSGAVSPNAKGDNKAEDDAKSLLGSVEAKPDAESEDHKSDTSDEVFGIKNKVL